MANFIGAIEQFNPYIQQIPTEAYTKVGMFKEQQYDAGVQKIQETVDHIAGLDIANEGGRNYLRARVDELTNSLNKYGQTTDFSNPNNVTQLVGLAKPLYQDENIVNDVINTSVYRNWAKEAQSAFKSGKMELGQYVRESSDASQWLNSPSAGADYTGRQAPNTATKKDLTERILKAKKDGMEKNEFVYDDSLDKDHPYYVKHTNKYYSEADFNNFITETIMDTKDREMLMNEHWYENQGVPTEELQKQDIEMYQAKVNDNKARIEHITEYAKTLSGDAKAEQEQIVRDLQNYNRSLENGKMSYLKELNLADPSSRDVFHRDLSETRYTQSLKVLQDTVRKEEYQKNEEWFTLMELKKAEIEAAQKAGTGTTAKGKAKNLEDITDEVSLYTPALSSDEKTEVSLTTIRSGWDRKNNQINETMNNMINKLMQNGVDMSKYMATNRDGSLSWDQVQVGTQGGAAKAVPRFKSPEAKKQFYNLVAGLDYAYTQEAADGKMDNKSFKDFIKNNFTDYNDADPNSKFTYADKVVADALNDLKGTSALIPKLEGLFADKSFVTSMAAIDGAIKGKNDMANIYREVMLKSGALTAEEAKKLQTLKNEDLMSGGYLNKDQNRADLLKANQTSLYSFKEEPDGTVSLYENIYNNQNKAKEFGENYKDQMVGDEFVEYQLGKPNTKRKVGNYSADQASGIAAANIDNETKVKRAKDVAEQVFFGAKPIDPNNIFSESTLDKVDNYVRQTYSYIQENLNTTVTNLKQDKPAYDAITDGLTLFINRAKTVAGNQDIFIDGKLDPTTIAGIKDLQILGASVRNSSDIFDPNPTYEVSFTATVPGGKDNKFETVPVNARISVKSFLAANPNYRTSGYAKYFAPFVYAEKDAYDRMKATINPLQGSEASYNNRSDVEQIDNTIKSKTGKPGFLYDENASGIGGLQYQWETFPVEKDGKQTMISYQVVSAGQSASAYNVKNKDGQQYENGQYYVKIKIPTSNGEPKILFLKDQNGQSMRFGSASHAHYTVKDLIFGNPEIGMEDLDPKTNGTNYFTLNTGTIRGILNTQLIYNGYPKIEINKLKDALQKQADKKALSPEEQATVDQYNKSPLFVK